MISKIKKYICYISCLPHLVNMYTYIFYMIIQEIQKIRLKKFV